MSRKAWSHPSGEEGFENSSIRDFDLSHLKSAELAKTPPKIHLGAVLQETNVKDERDTGAVFTEHGASASQMAAAKFLDTIQKKLAWHGWKKHVTHFPRTLSLRWPKHPHCQIARRRMSWDSKTQKVGIRLTIVCCKIISRLVFRVFRWRQEISETMSSVQKNNSPVTEAGKNSRRQFQKHFSLSRFTMESWHTHPSSFRNERSGRQSRPQSGKKEQLSHSWWLPQEWWDCMTECHPPNAARQSGHMARQHPRKGMARHVTDHEVPFGTLVGYISIEPKDKSRIHSFGQTNDERNVLLLREIF